MTLSILIINYYIDSLFIIYINSLNRDIIREVDQTLNRKTFKYVSNYYVLDMYDYSEYKIFIQTFFVSSVLLSY